MEEMLGNVPGARQIYERWMSFEPDHHGWMSFIKVQASALPPLNLETLQQRDWQPILAMQGYLLPGSKLP